MELWPLLAAERPVCTVKSPSSHSTPGLREAETARESEASSIMANWGSGDGGFRWMRFINREKKCFNLRIKN